MVQRALTTEPHHQAVNKYIHKLPEQSLVLTWLNETIIFDRTGKKKKDANINKCHCYKSKKCGIKNIWRRVHTLVMFLTSEHHILSRTLRSPSDIEPRIHHKTSQGWWAATFNSS